MSTMRTVPFGPDMQKHATLLLAAADDLEMDPAVVRTTSTGFVVPQEVLDSSGLEGEAVPVEDSAEEEESSHDGNSEPAPAKKAVAKKTAKKASAKKTASRE